MAVKDIEFTYGEGQTFSAPQWATESTLQKLVEAMGGSKAEKKENAKNIETLAQAAKQFEKSSKDNAENISDAVGDASQKLKKSAEATLGHMGKVGAVLDKVVGGALLVLGSMITLTTAKFVQLGSNLNALSQSGLALEGSTIQNIAALNEFGMGTADASKFMMENAQAFRILGQGATTDVIDTFLQVTEQGNKLGMSLEDTISLIGDELTLRTNLFSLAKLDQSQQKAMMQGVTKLNKEQLGYSKALGISTEVQREFTQQVLGNNQMLMASFLRMPTETQAGLTTGVASFVSGMRAMGGEAGGEIAAAVLEAASMGAIGFSDAAYGFITVLPSMAQNFQGVIRDFESGFIDGKQAAMTLTNQLGNLSDGEKSRVFLLARTGDEQAKMMAKAIKQFEQSAETMKKQGTTIEAVQKGFNAVNTIISKFKGILSSITNNFMAGFGEGIEELSGYMEGFANRFQSLFLTFFGMNKAIGSTSDKIQDFGRTVGKDFGDKIAKMLTFLEGYINNLDGLSFGDKITKILTNMGEALVTGILNVIPWKTTIAIAFGVALAAMLTKAAIVAAASFAVGGGAAVATTAAVGGTAAVAGGGLLAGLGAGITAAIVPIAIVTAALLGLGYALNLAGEGFKFMGEGAEKFANAKATKIKARSDAAIAATEATTKALKKLEGIDDTKMAAMAVSVDALGNSLASFASNMSPTVLTSIRSGFANLFGGDSPIKQVLAMSQDVNPEQVMDVAKAIMATNAANSGATSLDSSLQPAVVNNTTNNNNNTNTSNTNNSAQNNAEAIKILSEGMMSLNTAIVDLNTKTMKTNKLLTDIAGKT